MLVNEPTNAQIKFFGLDQAGASVIELMGAMAVGLVLLGATLQAMSHFQQEFVRQQRQLTQQQDLRLGVELLEQEVRLAGAGSLSAVMSDEMEFMANIHGLMTNVTAPAPIGQTTIAVDDGSGWPDRKTVRICWSDQCEYFTLARAGQKNLLTLTAPVPRMIPAGASVVPLNRVRYYCRVDEKRSLRFLRQIDGGSSVLVGDIDGVTFSFWDEQGRRTTRPADVRRIVVEVSVPRQAIKVVREISLTT